MKKLLILADTILPISSEPINDSALVVGGGGILDIGNVSVLRRKYKGVAELSLGEGILLPGFINAHIHLELGWIKKRIGKFRGFTSWLQQIIRGKREGVTNQEIEESVADGIKAQIESGVTTVGEISSYGGLDIPILKKSGLRTILFREVIDSKEDIVDFDTFELSDIYEERLFPHAPYSCSPGLLENTLTSHRKNSRPLGIHLAESKEEVEFVNRKANNIENKVFPLIDKKTFKRNKASTPFGYLKNLGFFDQTKITTVHMVQVEVGEVREIQNLDIGIVLCPRSNLFLQVGIPPLKEYSKLKRVGLGTDGLSSNYNLDFFEELRVLHLLWSQALGKEASYETIYSATLGGARALFLEDKIGSIEIGKEADLIFLNSKTEFKNPYLSVVSSTNDNLELVMVRGNILYSKESISSNN
ncbi:MAG: amidohydrolase family protein [Candidatus Dadabacteria bacterium]|nr:amidohydrolase family protein [Candidatus Dadabacteria bacterium]